MATDTFDETFQSEGDELEFLRFFYHKASAAMGPADGDIYDMIKANFTEKFGIDVPEDYYPPRAEMAAAFPPTIR